MVESFQFAPLLLSQAADTSNKLPPPTKAAALMALLGILLLGMLLVVVILVGGHWVRRWGSHRRGPAVPPDMALRPPPANLESENPPKIPDEGPNEGDTMIPNDTQIK